jgi:hypothetical protein
MRMDQVSGQPARIGLFRVSAQMIDRAPEFVRSVMACCIVVGVSYDKITDTFTYAALSPQFAEMPRSCVVPEYTWWLTHEGPLDQISVVAKCG